MDIMMPKMDGIEAVRMISAQCPTPVLLTSIIARYPEERARLGSFGGAPVELVEKPTLVGPSAAGEVSALLRRARALAFARGQNSRPPRLVPPPLVVALVVVAASTGGMPALAEVLRQLPDEFPPIGIAQHLDAEFLDSFVRFLRSEIGRPVQVIEDCAPVEPSRIYVAQKQHHLLVRQGQLCARPARPDELSPSADVLFQSVASTIGKEALGIVLTGMGRDGAVGLRSLRESGAWTIAQEPTSALVSGMPSAAVELGGSCEVLTLPQIAARLAAVRWKPWSNR